MKTSRADLFSLLKRLDTLLASADVEEVVGIPWNHVVTADIRTTEPEVKNLRSRLSKVMNELVTGPETSGDG